MLNAVEGEETPRYDRPLVVEAWYPANLAEGTEPGGEYDVVTRDGTTRATIFGRAVRGAPALEDEAPYPLVILSHGYPGNRFLMSHLGENLAGKGYVVVSIDHTDSTYGDQAAFGSTLLNRPLDQRFVLGEVARLSEEGSDSFLAGVADAERVGVVGYSMGGYGVVNLLGGGLTEASASFGAAPPNGLLSERGAGDEAYPGEADERIRAAIAIGPWGRNAGFFDAEGLAGITTPVLFMADSADGTSGYEEGTRAIFEEAVNADRHLLTFEHAGHNAAAPIPAPDEVWDTSGFDHYADPVWDTVRMNNVAQHFATAFFDAHLKEEEAKLAYFDVVEHAEDGTWAVDDAGEPTAEHDYWEGFPNWTARGLRLEHRAPDGE